MIRKIYHRKENFISGFHTETGKYFRTGILENGMDTGKEPFMADFPELIDVGIMGHCIYGRRGLCLKAGIGCYQNGPYAGKENMSLDFFQRIADECEGKTYQFALGGAGDPDQHEDFEEILRYSGKKGIIPNYTTSGFGMTEQLAEVSGRYCGAVAVSWYRSPYTWKAAEILTAQNVTTNIHYVLGRDSLGEAVSRLKNRDFPQGIHAVIFLLHKPVGLGKKDQVISVNDPGLEEFFRLIDEESFPFRIGFDSCMVPGILNFSETVDTDSVDTCEGGRFSCYITADGFLLPCSFDNQDQRWAYDLSKGTIHDGWSSTAFENFRDHLRQACPECKKRALCMGGCPVRPEIVLCREENKKRLFCEEQISKGLVESYVR